MSVNRTTNKLLRGGAILVMLTSIFTAISAGAQGNSRTFPQTGKAANGLFLQYWDNHGGLPQQGYPISDEMQEVSDLNGKTYKVQYFERAVFEQHPEYAGTEFEVLLSQLGTFAYRNRYQGGAPNQVPNSDNARLFTETGKTLGGRFRQYWEQNGGLMQQGYPISDEFQEVSALDGKTYKVQYFERAVFEYHPENGAPYDVLLSQLGTFAYRARYQATTPPNPTAAPAAVTFPRYGIDFLGGGNTTQAAAAHEAGVGVVRIGVSWNQIENTNSDPSGYNWSALDSRLKLIVDAGMTPLLAFGICPRWACTDSNGPIDKVAPSEMGDVAAAIAARYSVAPYNVHLWEWWNEPDSTYGDNHAYGWGQHGDQYAAMMAAGSSAVRGVDPAAKFAIGGLGYDFFQDGNPPGPFNRQFLRDVIAAGGGQYFDYVNFHYYPQQPYYTSIIGKTDAIKKLMSDVGANKRIIVTETSLTSDSEKTFQHPQWGPSNETIQSRYLAQTYVQSFASGIDSLTWFNIQDWTTDVAGLKIFEKTGLIRLDGSHKPVFSAYRTVVDLIGSRPFARTLSNVERGGDGIEGYAFGGNGEMWAVWTGDGGSRQVDLSNGTRAVGAVKNMYGEAVQVSSSGAGKVRVTLTGEPVYVEWR